jgi:hypothetical protein
MSDWSDRVLQEAVPPSTDWADEVLYDFATAPPPTKGSVQPIDPPSISDRLDVFGRGMREGVPIVGPALQGIHSRVRAGFRAAHTGRTPEQELADIQRQSDAMTERLPGTHLAGEITGGVVATAPLVAAAPGAFGLANASRLENIARAGTTAGLLTGADVAARGGTPEQQVQGALVGGALAGIMAPVFARLGGRAAAARSTAPTTVDDASRQASILYSQADAAGVRVAPSALADAATTIRQRAADAGFDPVLHPGAARLMAIQSERAAAGQVLSLRDLENIRRQATGIIRSTTSDDERRIVGRIVSDYDDFLARLGTRTGQVVAGDPAEARAAVTAARSLWRRASIAERLETAIDRASRHASGFAPGIRSEFRRLADDKKFMRGLADDDKAAIKKLGSIKNFRSFLTFVARFDPWRSPALAGGAGLVAGLGSSNLGVGAAVPVTGMAARSISDRIFRSRAEAIQSGVLRGSQRKPMSRAGMTLGAAFGISAGRTAGQ